MNATVLTLKLRAVVDMLLVLERARIHIEASGSTLKSFFCTRGSICAFLVIEAPEAAMVLKAAEGIAAENFVYVESYEIVSAEELRTSIIVSGPTA